jgi:hypothetical protein
VIVEPEIDRLYESTLKPRLEALEGMRLDLRRYIVKAGIWVGVPFLLFFLSDVIAALLPAAVSRLVAIGSFALIFVGVVVAGIKYLIPGVTAYMNYRSRFKHEVAAEVFKIVCPTAAYSPTQGVPAQIFDEPGIFATRGGYTSDDRVRGTIGVTPFEAADVSRSYSTGGKNSRTVIVFRGLFFHLDFNKRLTGTTIVQPAGASYSSLGDRSGFTPVQLENPTFAEAFAVYATDEVEARYILTPAMMEQILSLAARTAKPIYLGFKGNRAYLGINYERPLFEPGIAATTSVEAIQEMAAQFALAEGVVHELDLNTRIWTKDVDASLLHRRDDAPEDPLDALAARGNVTASELWQAATRSDDDGAEDEVVAQPSGTSIRVEQHGGSAVVHYGLSVGFFLALLLSLASGAVWVTAAKALPGHLEIPELTGATAWLPEIPSLPSIVSDEPIPFVIVASIVFPIAALIWVFRVRRVEVDPSAVRIWRGLRPWPRTYARPTYGKVVRLDKTVYVGKVEGFGLVNPSASPMLSVDEARWVASELRRALRSTAH